MGCFLLTEREIFYRLQQCPGVVFVHNLLRVHRPGHVWTVRALPMGMWSYGYLHGLVRLSPISSKVNISTKGFVCNSQCVV